MSWSRGPRSRGLVVLAALTLACGLSGCFQPLYSEAAHPGLVEDLRAIEVAPIKDRIGHYLADNLTTDLNGTGQNSAAKVSAHRDRHDRRVDAYGQLAYKRRDFGDHDGPSPFYAHQGRWRRAGAHRRRRRERVLRSFSAALQRSARRARRRDSSGALAVAGYLSAPLRAAGRENLMRAAPGSRARMMRFGRTIVIASHRASITPVLGRAMAKQSRRPGPAAWIATSLRSSR